MELGVDLLELERRARAIALRLRRGDIRIVELALQPALGRYGAPARAFHPHAPLAAARAKSPSFSPRFLHQFAQNAFAQAAIGDAQPGARPHRVDGAENRAAGNDQIGALLADAAQLRAPRPVERLQHLHHRKNLGAIVPGRVHPRAHITRQPQGDAGQRRHRARSAQQMMARDIEGGLLVHLAPHRAEAGEHRFAHGGKKRAAIGLGQRHDAKRNRGEMHQRGLAGFALAARSLPSNRRRCRRRARRHRPRRSAGRSRWRPAWPLPPR